LSEINIRESIEKSVLESLEELQIEDVFPIKVSRIQRSSFGDYSVSVAMEIAKAKKKIRWSGRKKKAN
jgi:arginyl-tRNA synthetase